MSMNIKVVQPEDAGDLEFTQPKYYFGQMLEDEEGDVGFVIQMRFRGMVMKNSIIVIFPYSYKGAWVFDDSATGLVKEPFICGMSEIINVLVKDIPNANSGFKLLVSATPFPGFGAKLDWSLADYGGNWYCWHEKEMAGWLCPALYKYFSEAPKELFLKAEEGKNHVNEH